MNITGPYKRVMAILVLNRPPAMNEAVAYLVARTGPRRTWEVELGYKDPELFSPLSLVSVLNLIHIVTMVNFPTYS